MGKGGGALFRECGYQVLKGIILVLSDGCSQLCHMYMSRESLACYLGIRLSLFRSCIKDI